VSIGLVGSLLVASVIAGLCFLYVWQGTRLHELTAQREGARERLAKIEGVNRELEFQIEQAFSLERVARIARTQLGMIEPTVVRYVPLFADEAD